MTAQVGIGARVKPVVEVDGSRFRDLDGNGVLDPYEDCRLSPQERAADLVAEVTPLKIALMVISSRSTGIPQPVPEVTSHDGAPHEQYHRFENDPHTAGLPYEGTTQPVTELGMRHVLMRKTPRGAVIAASADAMNEVAEGTRLGVPVVVAANSENEVGGVTMGSAGRPLLRSDQAQEPIDLTQVAAGAAADRGDDTEGDHAHHVDGSVPDRRQSPFRARAKVPGRSRTSRTTG